jgi:uncharacterized protein YecE (DUF72 family)
MVEPRLHVGCCGFPAARRTYFETLEAIEVQQTFYQPPRPETANRWRVEAPAGFVFTLKAWQLITHPPSSPTYRRLSRPVPPGNLRRYGSFRLTDEVREAWEVTLAIASALRAEVVLFQCPASFRPTAENVANLSAFFRSVEHGAFRLAWEPRGGWSEALVRDLCRDLDLVHCVDPFAAVSATEGPLYYRLHGIGGYGYRYTDEDLRRLAGLCRGRGGHLFFNNAHMLGDAVRFRRLVGQLPGR